MSTVRQPTFYIPHGGGPCFFMEWTMGPPDTWERTAAWLRGLGDTLPEPPRALLVVSAHWEQPEPTVLSAAEPPLLYDYYGFPPHTYELTWPAPGSPELAERIVQLLAAARIEADRDETRGFDHGVFIPLKLSYPDANIPTVQLSLVEGLDPARHIALGRALSALRDEGVVIIGSGMSYHNMRGFGRPESLPASRAFDAWLADTVTAPQSERERRLIAWTDAPEARAVHPREEHLLPLMVAAGAAGPDAGSTIFRDDVMAVTVSSTRFG